LCDFLKIARCKDNKPKIRNRGEKGIKTHIKITFLGSKSFRVPVFVA